MVVISLLPPLSYCGAKVSCQHFLLGYKNIALFSPRVMARVFVEDHNSVLQVPVNVMQLEVGVADLPPCTPLNQSVDGRVYLQEGHPVLIFRKDRKWLW